jgi:glycine/D-amino acid oxidase-like deaminating enzyme
MHNSTKTQLSYWEIQTYFENVDLIVVGSGIVGLSSAIQYKQKHPKSKIIVLERGVLPYGASTKNAGFACFGSVSELLSDLSKGQEATVWDTVEMRIKGLELLRKTLGDTNIDYQEHGGYELFDNTERFDECVDKIMEFNKIVKPYTKSTETYKVASKKITKFGFNHVNGLILNTKEGQLDTGKMMKNLIQLAVSKGIIILNQINVNTINDNVTYVEIKTSINTIKTKKVIIATNGFASQLLKLKDINPARAQVLVTKPLQNLKFKGTFHYDEGYYYFRNIGNRVLFGGGRNIDFEGETTTEFSLNESIQKRLDYLLKHIILPQTKYEVEHRWCGIMGVGSEKKPIIQSVSNNVVCAVRMGGMGVAIGSLVGKLAISKI